MHQFVTSIYQLFKYVSICHEYVPIHIAMHVCTTTTYIVTTKRANNYNYYNVENEKNYSSYVLLSGFSEMICGSYIATWQTCDFVVGE